MIGKTNLAVSGGEELNVFVQKDEPSKKDGVWIKTEEILTDEVKSYTQNTNSPYEISDYTGSGTTATVETDVYIFCDSRKVIKYDTLTDTYTELSNLPIGTGIKATSQVIGTDIYLFIVRSSYSYPTYKYDTLTDTYTELSSQPISSSYFKSVLYGTDVYLFAGANSYSQTYKYNTLTDTYTQLANIPYSFSDGAVGIVDTNVYLFGSSYSSSYYRYFYKYNILANSYTALTSLSFNFFGGSQVTIGTDIYLLGTNNSDIAYKYKTKSGEFIQLTNIPYKFYNGSATTVNNKIYLLGGSSSKTSNYKMELYSYPEISKLDYEAIEIKDIGLYDLSNQNSAKMQLANTLKSNNYMATPLENGNVLLSHYGESTASNNVDYIYDRYTNSSSTTSQNPLYATITSSKPIIVNKGNYIYYFGQVSTALATAAAYRRDINSFTTSPTSLTSPPSGMYKGAGVVVGDYIYLFYYGTYAYKYSIANDTYTQLAEIPEATSSYYICKAFVINGYIYLSTGKKILKYDYTTDTYEVEASIPSSYWYSTSYTDIYANIDDTIYIIYSASKAIAYNTITKTFTELSTQPNSTFDYRSGMTVIDNYIYQFGGSSALAYKYFPTYLFSGNNKVAILTRNKNHKVNLSEKVSEYIEYANLIQNGELAEYPCYYGDGTNWNLIEK